MNFFVSWKNDFRFGEKNISSELKHNYKHHQFCFDFHSSPYIRLVNDSFASKSFIDAIVKNDFDSAKLYISKFGLFVDFDEIKKIFNGIKAYNCVPVYYKNKNSTLIKNEKINSFFVSDKNKKLILHFFLINEPDRFSKWKIYRIEEEYVAGFFERKKLWINF